jgi:DNA-binding transcriptional MerR regulator
MRIAELSRRSGLPVATIKYYLREGLLPAGELTSPNQARYGEDHLRRLRLIRALVNVGGMSIGQVRDVLAAVNSPGKSVHPVLGVVQRSIAMPRDQGTGESWRDARREVAELITRRGWRAKANSPAGHTLAAVTAALRELGHDDLVRMHEVYAQACERIAKAELDLVATSEKVEDLVEAVAIGTVLGDAAIAAIRRLAHQDASARLFDGYSRGHPGDRSRSSASPNA